MPEESPLVLSASLHDIRYFTSLLRGVNFTNRATVIVTEQGLTITVEEARTLLGTAFIFANIFDEYKYNPEPSASANANDEDESEESNTTFEIPLNTLIDCLNIFGTASAPITGASTTVSKKWRKAEEGSEGEEGGRGGSVGGGGGGQEAYFNGGSDKKTGMRMSYAGAGYPLTLLIAEEISGPTTTCEITTFTPEPHLDLYFDNSRMVLKFILKSSWLRDALSELDPSCEKLTFIANPPQEGDASNVHPRQRLASKPILRIQAIGTFGSTEMDYPNDRDVLETFECTRPVCFSYRFSHISKALKVLQSSTKTSLRIDEEGLLSLQFLMPSPRPRGAGGDEADGFIDFNCLALDEEL